MQIYSNHNSQIKTFRPFSAVTIGILSKQDINKYVFLIKLYKSNSNNIKVKLETYYNKNNNKVGKINKSYR